MSKVDPIERIVLGEVANAKLVNPKDYSVVKDSIRKKLLAKYGNDSSWEYKVITAKVLRAISVRQESMGYISGEHKKARYVFKVCKSPKQALSPWLYAAGFITLADVHRMYNISKERYGVIESTVPKSSTSALGFLKALFKI